MAKMASRPALRKSRARGIRPTIRGKRWTRRRSAEVPAIAPLNLSNVMWGRLARFSQEHLERLLNALDMEVHFCVRRPWSSGRLEPASPGNISNRASPPTAAESGVGSVRMGTMARRTCRRFGARNRCPSPLPYWCGARQPRVELRRPGGRSRGFPQTTTRARRALAVQD